MPGLLRPSSRVSFWIVFIETPVIRTVELMELPSTRHRMTATRCCLVSCFMSLLCLSGQGLSIKCLPFR